MKNIILYNGKTLEPQPEGEVLAAKYVALFTGPAVRDAQYYMGKDEDMPLEEDEDWADAQDAELFIGIFATTSETANAEAALLSAIADREGVLPAAIRLVKV